MSEENAPAFLSVAGPHLGRQAANGTSLTLTASEVQELTEYQRPAQQLAELNRQGFWRARRAPITGRVVLERAHYEAVCAGADLVPGVKTRRGPEPEPQLSPDD